MQAKDVIARARIILQDAGADYWGESELPMWLTDGRMEAYSLRPDLYTRTVVATLVAGPRQTVPDGEKGPVEVVHNVSNANQRRVTPTDDALLSLSRPNWRKGSGASEVIHYLYSPARPTEYEVYPPALAGVQVEVTYPRKPSGVESTSDTTELAEEGEHAQSLVDYVLYRAFLKEADTVPASYDRAMQHLAAFRAGFTLAQPQPQQN